MKSLEFAFEINRSVETIHIVAYQPQEVAGELFENERFRIALSEVASLILK